MERSEPRVVRYWQLKGTLVAIVVVAQLALLAAAFEPMREPLFGAWRLLWIALAVVLVVVAVVLATASVRFRLLAFRVDQVQLRVRSGLFVHREKIVPTSRLQHVDVVSGPLERLFGLASLVVFTAGGQGATYRLPGLRPSRADELRALMLAAAQSMRASDGT